VDWTRGLIGNADREEAENRKGTRVETHCERAEDQGARAAPSYHISIIHPSLFHHCFISFRLRFDWNEISLTLLLYYYKRFYSNS